LAAAANLNDNRAHRREMASTEEIRRRVEEIIGSLPEHVTLVAAAKTRTPEEVRAAIEAGVSHIGHNYVQEAEAMRRALADWEESLAHKPTWHLIGHLQRNKAKRAVGLFDTIETLDSVRLARALQKRLERRDETMPVLIEVNSGKESAKTGVAPGKVRELVEETSKLGLLRVQGLMTMGPAFGDPEDARPYFKLTRQLFEELSSLELENVEMRYLSMGMSNSYEQAVEEGANIVRIGTRLFGPRPKP
jgi:hypothetical protein